MIVLGGVGLWIRVRRGGSGGSGDRRGSEGW